MKLTWKHYSIAVIILILAGFVIKFLYFSGRSASRILGKSARQTLHIKNMAANGFISISFDKRGKNTVKDVTFKATDGYVYTLEYMDMNPFGGTIRWVPYGEGSDLVQSRSLSRWFGDIVNLEIPEKCKKILGVDITYAQKDERTKNLTCITLDGIILSKEYREGIIDRHFEGYIEIKPKN
tara:strand:- start:23018 stop:23560 length:543 start_codon:yes stop_codon:yes gene_type:complete